MATKVKAQRFGWHASTDVDPNFIADVVRKSHARTHTALNSVGLAMQIYDAAASVIEEEPIVVARIAYPDQDWKKNGHDDPDSFVKSHAGLMGGKLYLQYLNEPVVGNPAQLTDMLNHCIAFMTACEKYGVRGSVGAFPDAAILNNDWIDAGLFDAFLKKAVPWTRAGRGVINHHQYTYGSLPHGGGGRSPWDMTDPKLMQPAGWPTKAEMIANARSNWLIYRNRLLLDRAVKVAGQEYLWIIGEATHDDMNNLRTEGVSPAVEAKAVGGRKLRGLVDQKDLFPWWWPQWSPAQGYIEQLRWFDGVLPESCLGVTIFALNNDPQWRSYNPMYWPEFWPVFYSFADGLSKGKTPVTTYDPVPKPANAGVGTSATLNEDYNLRQGPGTEYTSVVTLKKGVSVVTYPTTRRMDKAGKFPWLIVEGAGQTGWMADQGQFIAPLPAYNDAQALLDVPYVDQNNKDTAPDANDCGQAEAVGALAYIGYKANKPALTKITVNQANDQLGNTQLGTNGGQLVKLLAAYGVTAYAKTGVTLDFIRQQIDAGLPFLALVQRGELGNPKLAAVTPVYKLAHWITVIGYGPGFFVINDPYAGIDAGYRAVVTEAAFTKAFSSSTFTGGTNAGYQGVYFKADTLQPATPNPQPEQPAEPDPKLRYLTVFVVWANADELAAAKTQFGDRLELADVGQHYLIEGAEAEPGK